MRMEKKIIKVLKTNENIVKRRSRKEKEKECNNIRIERKGYTYENKEIKRRN